MLKNKSKIITLLIVIILALMIPTVRAENEEQAIQAVQDVENEAILATENEEIEQTSEEAEVTNSQTVTENSDNDTFKKSDVYLTGDDVTIDYIVDGNLFVFADTVTINSQIGGDAFICAKTINIENNGYIFSNLFAIAQNINISGVVYDLYTCSNELNINGYIYRDIRSSTNTLNINGTIGRNAYVTANNINFANNSEDEATLTLKGIINGDFNYTSPKEISIPEGAVSGTTNFAKAEENQSSNDTSIQSYFLSLGEFLATVAILWLLCLWLAPKFLKNTNNSISKKLLPSIGFGILTPIIIVVLSVILLLLGITSKIAVLSIGLLFLLLAVGSSIFVISINNIICDKLKVQKNVGTFGMLLISAAILWLITLIPYVGSIVNLIASIVGLGIIVINIISNKKNIVNEKNVDNKNI